MYIWHFKTVTGAGGVDDMMGKARRHRISSLWVKLGDGESAIRERGATLSSLLAEFVAKGSAASIAVLGYHVPWCNPASCA
jgi:hypothetical protein